VTIKDIEQLNQLVLKEAIDVTKVSFHAFGYVRQNYALLASGAALGRGCGPLLVGRDNITRDQLESARIAIPGWYTSATLLLRMFAPQLRREQLIEVVFGEHFADAIGLLLEVGIYSFAQGDDAGIVA